MLKKLITVILTVSIMLIFSGCNLISKTINAIPKNTVNPIEKEQEVISVGDLDGFISAIGSNRKIILQEGTYNLSDVKDTKKNRNLNLSKYVQADENGREYDVEQFEIYNVNNLIIEGIGNVKIISDRINTNTLDFNTSNGVTLKNIIIKCAKSRDSYYGDALSISNSQNIMIENCTLDGYNFICNIYNSENIKINSTNFSAGSIGFISLDKSNNIELNKCSFNDTETWWEYGCVYLENKSSCVINNSSFNNNKGYADDGTDKMLSLTEDSSLVLNNCSFENNTNLVLGSKEAVLNNCTFKNNSFKP